MKIPLERLASLFALLFTPAMPLFSGLVVIGCHQVFRDTVAKQYDSRPEGFYAQIPEVFRWSLDNLNALLWGEFVIALALVVCAWLVLFVRDATDRLGMHLVLASTGAFVGVAFLGIYLYSIAHVLQSFL